MVSLISFYMFEVIFQMSDYSHDDSSQFKFHISMGGGGNVD